MKHVTAALAAAVSVSGCAADLAQGYRSTPDYPAYANARDGYSDAADCATRLGGMAFAESFARDLERESGYDIDSGSPTSGDWLGGLVMSMIFAAAENRPYTAYDACAGAAAADSGARRREGYSPRY